jgi:CheY-like chemotaxis protein
MRALVVEDNAVNMLIAVAMLQDWGLMVEQAVDGRAALALVAAQDPAQPGFDVVLMDLQMPGVDGITATRELRARGVRTPIVALTATVVDGVRREALQAGFDEVLSKPIDSERLLHLLHQLYTNSQHRRIAAWPD